MNNEKTKRKLPKSLKVLLLAVTGLVIVCCVGLVAWYTYDMSTPEGQATATVIAANLRVTRTARAVAASATETEEARPTVTPMPTSTQAPTDIPTATRTVAPTNTLAPTSTTAPTNTPVPTNTTIPTDTPTATSTTAPTATSTSTVTPTSSPTPNPAPSFTEITDNYNRMTEAQWKAYADTLRGTWAQDWEGTVNDVTKGSLFSRYDVFIDAGRPSFGSDVFIGDVPEDVALALNKGARVRFSGTLDFVSDFLGFSVHLDGQTTTFTVIEQ